MNTQPNTSEALSLSNEELIQEAVNNDEGVIASNGAFSTSTGAVSYTHLTLPTKA